MRTFIRRARTPLALVWSALLLTAMARSSLAAQDAVTQSAGGGGGDPYTITCGTKAMVGIQGKWGDHLVGFYVNEVQPLCVAINTNGSWIGTPAPTSTFAGVNTGSFASLLCSPGEAVAGFFGQGGFYVDRFEIYCQSIGDFGHLTGTASPRDAKIGGEWMIGGTFFGAFLCPNNKPGKGLTGRAHDWIDRMAIICNFPSVPPPSVATMYMTPQTIVGGNPVTGHFTLNAPATAGGISVGLSIQVLAADVSKIPSSPLSANPVVVPEGQTDGSFVFSTLPVTSPVGVSINVGTPTKVVTASFSILPPSLTTLSLSPSRVAPGASSTGTISVNGAAPVGGVSVNLTSSVPATATVPTTVVISQGQTSATFPVAVSATSKSACTIVTASGVYAPQGSLPTRQTVLPVIAPANQTFALSVGSTFSGGATASITYPTIAKESRSLTLASSNPALAGVPSTVSVPLNAASVDFTVGIQGTPPSGLNCVVITATDPKGNANALVFEIVGSSIKWLK